MPIITVFASERICHRLSFPKKIRGVEMYENVNLDSTILIRGHEGNVETEKLDCKYTSDLAARFNELKPSLSEDDFLIIFVQPGLQDEPSESKDTSKDKSFLQYSDLILVHQSEAGDNYGIFDLSTETGLGENKHKVPKDTESYYYVFFGDEATPIDSEQIWYMFREIMESIADENIQYSETLESLRKFLEGFGIKHRISLLDKYAACRVLGDGGQEILTDLKRLGIKLENGDIEQSLEQARKEMSKLLLLPE